MQKCLYCQKEFEPDGSVNRRKRPKSLNEGKFCSIMCGMKYRHANTEKSKPNVNCAYCGKNFYLNTSKQKNSKSGLFFCCREHKDLAQRIEFNLKQIWPEKYNNNGSTTRFRELALRNKEHKCENCGYNKFISVLEVHHIDRDRNNNDLSNLKLLCPTCHQEQHFITKTGRYTQG